MAAVLAGLKSVDFYRKLKRDLQQELTEASIAGAALVRAPMASVLRATTLACATNLAMVLVRSLHAAYRRGIGGAPRFAEVAPCKMSLLF